MVEITSADARSQGYSAEWLAWRDPDVPETLSPTEYLLDRHVRGGHGGRTALIVDDTHHSYGDLLALVEQTAAALQELGLGRGERLLMIGTDSIEFVALWLACVRAGVIPVVVSDGAKAAQVGYFLGDAEPSAVYVDAPQVVKLAEVADTVAAPPRVLLVRGDDAARISAWSSVTQIRFESLVAQEREAVEPVQLHSTDIAYMLYSGSTTGPAKGVPHLAHDFVLVPERQGAFWEYHPGDVVHATSKKYFTHGLWPGVLIPLYWGATGVLSSEPATAANVVDIVRRHRPSKLITVPTTVTAIVRYAEEATGECDFSSVKLVVTASEAVPPDIVDKFEELFGLEVMDLIGSSEITYAWISNRPGDHRRGTLGRPIFGYEVKLVKPGTDEIAAVGEQGEAWVRSRTAAPYYWRKDEATEATFVDGWTRTGDVLCTDEDGYFKYVSRLNDVFKVNGMWVSPLEVETVISGHPSIHEVAVVGGVDVATGLAKPLAFVVLRPGTEGNSQLTAELRERVRAIGGYKVPEIHYIDVLPRTPLMKIDRKALREGLAESRSLADA